MSGLGIDYSTAVKRFGIVHSDTGAVESGACYPGCSPSNIPACQPMSFPSQAAFNQFADGRGEWPVILGSAIPDTPAWNDLRNQAFSSCMQTAPTTPVSFGPSFSFPQVPSSSGAPITITAPTGKPVANFPTGVNVPNVIYIPGQGPVVDTGTTPAPTDYTPYLVAGGLALLLLR